MTQRRSFHVFSGWLSAIAVFAFAVRLQHAFRVAGALGGDAVWYHKLSLLLADGQGYVHPLRFSVDGVSVPSAFKPPLFSNVLAVAAEFGVRTINGQRVVNCVIGTITVVLVGFVGRSSLANGPGFLRPYWRPCTPTCG